MKIREIVYSGLMGSSQHVKLPATGLVLVTGPNGSGKSTLMESISYGLWGKSLRGTDPRSTVGGVKIIVEPGIEVYRVWDANNKNTLSAGAPGYPLFEFDTVTKAQDHVITLLGEWDTWQRSCAFRATGSGFASATDVERKRLLEAILGLHQFDKALTACQAEVKGRSASLQVAGMAYERAEASMAATRVGVVDMERLVSSIKPPMDLSSMRARLDTVKALRTDREREFNTEEQLATAARERKLSWESDLKRLERQLSELVSNPQCPTCDQPWPDASHRDVERQKLMAAITSHQDNYPKPPDTARLNSAREALAHSTAAINQLTGEINAGERAERTYNDAAAGLAEAKLRLAEIEADAIARKEEEAVLKAELEQFNAVCKVLGMRGARSMVLDKALVMLEQLGNHWLDRIARVNKPISMTLKPSTTRASGTVVDTIALHIDGVSGGKGYDAASSGEQRRIDIALMLALADLARGQAGVDPSTLFFDEVLDALDDAGVLAVAGVFRDLAKERCVVLITHNASLVEALAEGATHIKMG